MWGCEPQSFFDSNFDPLTEYAKLVGTGLLYREKNGEIREMIKYVRESGFAGWDSLVPTDIIGIRHSKKGGHLFPVHPNEYEKKIKMLKDTKKSR